MIPFLVHKKASIKNAKTNIIGKFNILIISSTKIGETKEEAPITSKMLLILDPITFPTSISPSPFFAEDIATDSSGREVPRATIESPIIESDTPKKVANLTAELTSSLLEINKTTNFENPYNSLSKYATVKMSSDNKFKLYCWDQKNFGCAWDSKAYVQFKTKNNQIKTICLGNEYASNLFYSKLHTIKINNKNHYLLIGYGGHCGNHKYKCAVVYKVDDENLIKTFEVCSNSNRMGKLDMNYNLNTKILSYNDYFFDKNSGFYSNKKTLKKWKLNKNGFEKIE